MDEIHPSSSVDVHLETADGVCALTHGDLPVQDIIQSVADDGVGATTVFIGTTRNSFKGKVVTKLQYQAYSKLALKTMAAILAEAQASAIRDEHRTTEKPAIALLRCAVWHRLGTVPVGHPSIVIAVSSPHRKEAFVACEMILEEIKRRAQIWKREYYEGEPEEAAEWKANA